MKQYDSLRNNEIKPKKINDNPLVSIITPVFNGKSYLEETIQSVISQTYENIEYIIIDGGSTDGSLEIIQKYEDKINYWISEPDRGIYDAMNKGIDVVRGEWINFMNAGDIFYADTTIRDLFLNNRIQADFLYGDCEVRYDHFLRLRKALSLDCLWKGMIFSHQSMFVKADIQKAHKYDISNRIHADFEFIFKQQKAGSVFRYVNRTISVVRAGGVSDIMRFNVIKGHWSTVREKSSGLWVDVYYSYLFLDAFFRKVIRKVLPKLMVEKILRWKYRA